MSGYRNNQGFPGRGRERGQPSHHHSHHHQQDKSGLDLAALLGLDADSLSGYDDGGFGNSNHSTHSVHSTMGGFQQPPPGFPPFPEFPGFEGSGNTNMGEVPPQLRRNTSNLAAGLSSAGFPGSGSSRPSQQRPQGFNLASQQQPHPGFMSFNDAGSSRPAQQPPHPQRQAFTAGPCPSGSRQQQQPHQQGQGFTSAGPSSQQPARSQGFTPAGPSSQPPPRPQGRVCTSGSSGTSQKPPQPRGQQGFSTASSPMTTTEHDPMDPFAMPWKPRKETPQAQFEHYHEAFGHLPREQFSRLVEQEARRIKGAGGWEVVKYNSSFLAATNPPKPKPKPVEPTPRHS